MKFIPFFLLVLLFSCGNSLREKPISDTKGNDQETQTIEPINFEKTAEMIDESKYWRIIEKSFIEGKSYNQQRSELVNELLKLTPKEITEFSLRTSNLLKKSYTGDLWCAAYIIKGGCSDDGFEYFRCWLISEGKETFYKAIDSPDSLSKLKKRLLFDYEFEELLYIPGEVFSKKTGKQIYDYLDTDRFWEKNGFYKEIEFQWQENDQESMKTLCPNLFEKF